MAGMTSLGTAVSGLSAAQAGLYVTGHNMANVNTAGFSRQRVLQSDFVSSNIGYNANGFMQVGLGTDITSISQIRNKFLDISYRKEVSKASFYEAKYTTGVEVESIIGELESEYKTQSVLQDLWDALNELAKAPDGLDTRGNFISTAVTFINKTNNVFDRLFDYQQNINEQVMMGVNRINQLVEEINFYNGLISNAEASGDHANDYRDSRNNCLDELASLIDINYKENIHGQVDILVESKELLVGGNINKLGLRYTSADYSFVEPVFTNATTILGYPVHPGKEPVAPDPTDLIKYPGGATDPQYLSDKGDYDIVKAQYDIDITTPEYKAKMAEYIKGINVKPLFSFTSAVSSESGNDNGKLKGLLISRGLYPVNYATSPKPPAPPANPADPVQKAAYDFEMIEYKRANFNLTNCVIPKVEKELDTLVNNIVKMINDAFSPMVNGVRDDANTPYGLNKEQSDIEIFVRKNFDRFDGSGAFNPEVPNSYFTLYTIGNIQVNPLLLDADGFDKIPCSATPDMGDASILWGLLEQWKSTDFMSDGKNKMNVDDAYQRFISNLAVETNQSGRRYDGQMVLAQQTDNNRQMISGVSLDEEMTNMLKYQHAYNSSAKILNAIDDMLDRIINRTGRAGL